MPPHSKTVNDRVEKNLLRGFTREVIGELRGGCEEGLSWPAAACMSISVSKTNLTADIQPTQWGDASGQKKPLVLGLDSPHTAGQSRREGGGQRAVAGEASNDDELWRTWFFLL